MENLKAVAAVGEADVGVDGMHCSFHPFNAAGGGGICAFCLQEKLGKLVSSSLSFPSQRNSSSPSLSPSFRSDDVVPSTLSFTSSSMPHQAPGARHAKHSKVASFLARKKKKATVDEEGAPSMVFQRSRSVAFSAATPRSCHFYDVGGHGYSPRKRGGFWSFMSLSSSSRPHNSRNRDSGHSLSRTGQAVVEEDNVAVAPQNGVCPSPFENNNKVSRSRSVGCGSRSFSGDFFERISTGFMGDCTTLRRVESHREGKPPRASTSTSTTSEAHHHPHQCMKERVRCGGIFGGFAIANSSSSISSSSASSSSYWVPSSSNSAEDNVNLSGVSAKPPVYSHHHGRSKSWGWALASPMRAFSRPSSGKRSASAAIKPTSGMNGASLLAVGG